MRGGGPAPSTVATVALLVGLVALASAWVLGDARRREQAGDPVVAVVGPWTLDRPEVWAAACLVASVVALPLYLVARRAH